MTEDLLERTSTARPAPLLPDPEAVIEQARRRARRRRSVIGAAALLLVLAATGSWLITSRAKNDAAAKRQGSAKIGALAGVLPKHPAALAMLASGNLLIADTERDQILERLSNGRFRVFAGTGRHGFAGDGAAATDAAIDDPGGMAVARDGSVYFADVANNRIRKISTDGHIATVAGSGRGGWTETGTPALDASLLSPQAVAIGPDGRLYIAAAGASEVLRLERDGTLTRIAALRNRAGVAGLGGPATRASADGPSALAFDAHGNLFIAGQNTKTLLMIGRDGRMVIPAGSPGNAAPQLASGFYPRGVGGLVPFQGGVLGMTTQQLVRITGRGVAAVYHFEHGSIGGVTGFLPGGLAVAPTGRIYTDTARGNGSSSGSSIISIEPDGRVRTIWKK